MRTVFGEVLGNVDYPDGIVRQACICLYSESDLKYKDLTFQRIKFTLKLL